MSEYEDNIISVDPDIEKRPVLPAGDHGAEGNATLELCEVRPLPWDKSDNPEKGIHFDVLVRHDGNLMHVRADKSVTEQGSTLPKWLAQLGISRDEQKSNFNTKDLEGTKVVVTVGVKDYTNREGQPGQVNRMYNISKLED